MLQHHEGWLERNVVGGEALERADYTYFGGEVGEQYLLAMRVVTMGDVSAVDICQTVHQTLLESCGCVIPEETLLYGSMTPNGDCCGKVCILTTTS